LASSDPTNSLARVNFGITATSVGKILVQQGKVHQAMPYIKNAISIFEPIESKTHYDISHQAEAYAALAGIYIALSDRDRLPVNKATHLREACSWYEKSLLLWNKSVALVPADAYGAKESRRVAQELERCDAALARFHSPIKNNEQIRD
jgi:tetratricopeptide (TPR) repeat protein